MMVALPITDSRVPDAVYTTLAGFRGLLRRFLTFSETAARTAGLTPRQHQALLAIKGFPHAGGMSIHDLAEQLGIRHHSAVELVDRLAEADLVRRLRDPADARRVRLALTAPAEACLASLSAVHLEELRRLRPALLEMLAAIGDPPETGR